MKKRINYTILTILTLSKPAYSVSSADYEALKNRDSQTVVVPKDYTVTGPSEIKTYNFEFRTPADPSLSTRYANSTPSTANVDQNASNIVQKYRTQMGSSKKLNNNVYNPMQNGSAMTALDGQTQFAAQISCPTETPFLDIAAIPTSTGDLSQVIVIQNTDLQGPPENTVTLDNVSGICANGYISCDPGTWDNCLAYEWDIGPSPNYNFSSTPSDITNLVSCTCINNSCGSMLVFNNMPTVMDIIGGGIANTIAQANPEAQVSKVVTNDVQIQFFGQQISNCNILQKNPSAQNAKYYTDPTQMAADASLEVTSNSMYNLIQNSNITQQLDTTQSSCVTENKWTLTQLVKNEIANHINLQSDFCHAGGASISPPYTASQLGTIVPWADLGTNCATIENYSTVLNQTDYGQLTLSINHTRINGNKRIAIIESNFVIDDMSFIDTAIFTYLEYADHINVYLNGAKLITGASRNYNQSPANYQILNDTDFGIDLWWPYLSINATYPTLIPEVSPREILQPNIDIKSLLVEGINTIKIELVNGVDYGLLFANFVFNEAQTCQVSEWVEDTCPSLQNRSECTLITEIKDGIKTIDNYLPTGLSPLPSTQYQSTPNCINYPLTKPLWKTEQTYTCVGDPQVTYNFDTALARVQHVKDSANNADYNGYEDLVTDASGNTTAIAQNFTNRMDPNALTKEEACITERQVEDDQVAAIGVASEFRDPNTGLRTIRSYRTCIDGQCPIPSGDTLVQDCAILDSSSRVMSEINMIRQSGKDMTCTTGVLQQPAEAIIPPTQ